MKRTTILVTLWGTPIKVKAAVLGNVVVLWGILSWVGRHWHPERSLWISLLVGFVSMTALLVADFGHAIAHILSARYADAPMDEVLISAGMPRTVYLDNDVSPSAHRKRAVGGPIFSLVGSLLSLLVYAVSASGTLAREWAGWSLVGHGFILIGSLLPLPIVDGGSILKWTLVEKGRTPSQADEMVRRVNWAIGVLAGIAGVALIVLHSWVAGLAVMGVGGIAIGVALDKIK